MKSKLKIFFVSSEVEPFAKTSRAHAGGLAEVSAVLPKVLKELGHDVRMMMPSYRAVNERKHTLRDVIRLKDMAVEAGARFVKASGKSAFLPDSKVQIYLLNSKTYFDRDGLYQDAAGREYSDNAQRFIFFSRGCLETLKLLQWQPDVIHCNDWQTALIPVFLKTIYKDDPFFKSTSVLLTLHNIAEQGIFDPAVVNKAKLLPEVIKSAGILEFRGKINFLKGGILAADVVNAMSQTYAKAIQESPEYGMGLEEVLRVRRHELFGIVNGVNYADWNPETDKLIPYQYSVSNLGPKIMNKNALLDKVGLDFKEDIPVIGIISRLDHQKGFDLLMQIFERMMALGAAPRGLQMVILGTGDEKCHKLLSRLAKKYPRQVSVNLRSDNALAHLIEAGADLFLMPSRHEPGSLHQIYAMRYGTVPIVHAPGGLVDTVQNYDSRTESGTGFVFKKYEPEELLKAVERAIKVFHDTRRWTRLIKAVMRQDFSWQAAAAKFVKLYTRQVARKK
jgi:starch synthase